MSIDWPAMIALVGYASLRGAGRNDVILAARRLERMFPSLRIIPVDCREVCQTGGVLNCISWNILK